MTASRWPPGTHITGRSLWHGRVFAAWPYVVVDERDDMIALHTPPGAVWKRPTDIEGNDIRLPHGDWRLRDDVWYGHGVVRILLPGAAHSMLVFLEVGDVERWYVNLEQPFRKTAIGFDTRDNHLDLVFPGDLSEPRWKDEHELAEAVDLGIVTPAEAAAFRAEGERAIDWVRSGTHPAVDDRWRGWTAPEHWSIPALAEDWETHRLDAPAP
jgi:hypothetical protein